MNDSQIEWEWNVKKLSLGAILVKVDHYGHSGMVAQIKVSHFLNLKLLSMCDVRLNSIEGLCHVYMPQL